MITSASAVCNCVSSAPTGVTCSTIGGGGGSGGVSSIESGGVPYPPAAAGSSILSGVGAGAGSGSGSGIASSACVPGSSVNCAATASAVPSCAVSPCYLVEYCVRY